MGGQLNPKLNPLHKILQDRFKTSFEYSQQGIFVAPGVKYKFSPKLDTFQLHLGPGQRNKDRDYLAEWLNQTPTDTILCWRNSPRRPWLAICEDENIKAALDPPYKMHYQGWLLVLLEEALKLGDDYFSP